ncbi:MAG: hypothetical protein KatS3mg082_0045 [Nitrospiraceae bacterium]|jgi:hypothetical protein|nr:MAG: hypothetical protein KatS3mg082_0045 [Nitrospiraceae bacterium]
MGRTLPTATLLIEHERARWEKFRRALRKEDQALLDELLEDASRHRQAQAYASWATPYEAMLVAILLEDRKRIRRLEKLVAALQARDHPAPAGAGAVKTEEHDD